MKLSRFALLAALSVIASTTYLRQSHAWGNEGHQAIGLIAEHFLEPKVRAEVQALLAAPSDPDVPPVMRDRATWADAYRDSDRNTTKSRYLSTRSWHFVDIDVDAPDLKSACYGDGPAEKPASKGSPNDCVVRKIEQFAAELGDKSLPVEERTLALMFLLHFVGDVHQPLHAAERQHDQGGNKVQVIVEGRDMGENLHSYWDGRAVKSLGSTAEVIASRLIGEITPEDIAAWTKQETGKSAARDWALESWSVAKMVVYNFPDETIACQIRAFGRPPVDGKCHVLTMSYVSTASDQARNQIKRASVRLAKLLNDALR